MSTPDNEQLSKIETILLQLDISQEQSGVDNRRHAPRLNARMPLKVTLLSQANRTEVEIFSRNLSSGGIGFISRRLFKSNERFAIHLNIKGLPPRLILARVTFGRYVSAGMYEMGAEFLECVKNNQARVIPRQWLLASTRTEKPEKPEKPEPEAAAKPKEKAAPPTAPATPATA